MPIVQAGFQDGLHLRVIQLRAKHADALLRDAGEGPRGPGDGVEGLVRQPHAVAHRARELSIQQKKLHNAVGRNAPVALAVHFETAHRL